MGWLAGLQAMMMINSHMDFDECTFQNEAVLVIPSHAVRKHWNACISPVLNRGSNRTFCELDRWSSSAFSIPGTDLNAFERSYNSGRRL